MRIRLAPEERSAGVEALLGSAEAFRTDDPHGDTGLSFSLDITGPLDGLSQSAAVEPERVRTCIVPADGASHEAPITVDRLSVYAEPS